MDKTKSINFWQVSTVSNNKKIHYSKLLKSAFDQKILFSEEMNILEKFVNYTQEKNIQLSGQIMHTGPP